MYMYTHRVDVLIFGSVFKFDAQYLQILQNLPPKGLDLYRLTCPIGAGSLILRSWTLCEEPRRFCHGKVMILTCRS